MDDKGAYRTDASKSDDRSSGSSNNWIPLVIIIGAVAFVSVLYIKRRK